MKTVEVDTEDLKRWKNEIKYWRYWMTGFNAAGGNGMNDLSLRMAQIKMDDYIGQAK